MKILMVCLGNICRSPLAEGIMMTKLPKNFVVDSAGTIDLHQGQKPDQRAIITAKNNGVDISQQRSRPINKTDLETFDVIYCMDRQNFEDVMSIANTEKQRSKIKLLMQEAGNYSTEEVPDPFYGDMHDFEKIFGLLNEACEIVAEKLKS